MDYIELVRTKERYANVIDAASGRTVRVSIDEAERMVTAGKAVPHSVEEEDARRRVEHLLVRSRKLDPGPVRDDLYSQVRSIKRAYPHAFRDGAAPYQTHVGWRLEVFGGTETFSPRYVDCEDRSGLLRALDALGGLGYEVIHVSETRSIVEAEMETGKTSTTTDVTSVTYLLRRS